MSEDTVNLYYGSGLNLQQARSWVAMALDPSRPALSAEDFAFVAEIQSQLSAGTLNLMLVDDWNRLPDLSGAL